jgi:hypothetical protein
MDMGVGMDMDMAIFLLFRFVLDGLCVFWLYRNTETSCFVIKRNNRNKRLVSDSDETSFGSSFGYIETNLVS